MKLRNSKKKELIRAANKFQPWDYGFLLELEYESLKLMYKCFSETSKLYQERLTKSYKNRIKLAIDLLDIILEKKTAVYIIRQGKSYIDRYVNTKNWTRFFPDEPNKDVPVIKDVLRKEKAWNLYNIIRSRNLRHWWL